VGDKSRVKAARAASALACKVDWGDGGGKRGVWEGGKAGAGGGGGGVGRRLCGFLAAAPEVPLDANSRNTDRGPGRQ
jgi:hypothetical protein